jgi:hypothetical protein
VDRENYTMKDSVNFFVNKPFIIIISRRKRLARYAVSNREMIKSYRNLVRKPGKQKLLERQD